MIPGLAQENWNIVDSREEKRLKRIPQALEVEAYIKKLSKGEVTLSQIYEESPVLYSKNHSVFKVAREPIYQTQNLHLLELITTCKEKLEQENDSSGCLSSFIISKFAR